MFLYILDKVRLTDRHYLIKQKQMCPKLAILLTAIQYITLLQINHGGLWSSLDISRI